MYHMAQNQIPVPTMVLNVK
uniref:Uncharacterized protein n=1 Tax=Anguilla anguilla TaxID=7936 RepID=A0A0E9SPF3_ANGAN